MNPHRLLNEGGANYSAYRIRSFVGVLTRHLMEPNKYASRTLLPGLWAPAFLLGRSSFGRTFVLVSQKSVHYAWVVEGDTLLTHVLTLL